MSDASVLGKLLDVLHGGGCTGVVWRRELLLRWKAMAEVVGRELERWSTERGQVSCGERASAELGLVWNRGDAPTSVDSLRPSSATAVGYLQTNTSVENLGFRIDNIATNHSSYRTLIRYVIECTEAEQHVWLARSVHITTRFRALILSHCWYYCW